MRALWARHRVVLTLWAVSLAVYLALAGDRLRRASPEPHFAMQAEAWLKGHLDIDPWPANDNAAVEDVKLDDGTMVRGRRLTSRRFFRTTKNVEIPLARVKETVRTRHYVSFPPLPAVLMLPQVMVHGAKANDVAFTAIVASLVPPGMFLLLGLLRRRGRSTRTAAEDAWLALALGFGTIFFATSVQGQVWFTAHVVATALVIGYVAASIDAARPLIAGACLGLAFVTRTPTLFLAPLFVWEAWRAGRDGFVKRMALFGVPIAVIGIAAALHNHARFDSFTEFGHSYLTTRQQTQIEQHGLFSITYLGRNLATMLTGMPTLTAKAPFISIGGHGLALWLTSPFLLAVLWPRVKGDMHRILWATIACAAVPALLYQNSGWVQFSYRFALDYMVLLIVLIAVGGRPIGRGMKAWIAVAIAVQLFGAITFNRAPKFYKFDNPTYQCVVPH